MNQNTTPLIAKRFRGFLPVIVDVETAGLNPKRDALLEIAAVTTVMDENGNLHPHQCYADHIKPFASANIDPEALKLNKIDPYHPFRFAISEKEALTKLYKQIKQAVKTSQCQRAVLVGHNAWFDLLFLKAATTRCEIEKTPFHAFTTFDTATLAGLAYGQTVLAKACDAAKIEFDRNLAHSAVYDAEKTAELFCKIVNQWKLLERIENP